jgi:cellulose synthase/poly-beta-1,6-N-acetylglucosamine synthase-like glycosyltransferase
MGFAEWAVLGLTILFLAYFAYATPIILVGIWHYKKHGFGEDPGDDWDPPNVSILIPVKNEEKVVGRLLDALTKLDFPSSNLEVIIVEDASKDKTLEICQQYAREYSWFKVYHRDMSSGKGDALNYAFQQSHGEIVATFDSDDIPEPQSIKKALRYFNSPQVGAVHGYHKTLNLKESIVARLASYETFLYRLANDGKYKLRLFVTFSGSNTFFRRSALEQVGLWDAASLVEDAELSVRFAKAGIVTRLAPVESWQEMPAKVKSLFKQRIRWSGGNVQTGLKHWDSWRFMPWFRALDMEALMMSPIMAILTLVASIVLGLGVVRVGLPLGTLLPLIITMGVLNVVYFGTIVAVVLTQAKSGATSYLALIIATYPYAVLISAANMVGLVAVGILGRRMWLKTEKTGFVDGASTNTGISPLLAAASSEELGR